MKNPTSPHGCDQQGHIPESSSARLDFEDAHSSPAPFDVHDEAFGEPESIELVTWCMRGLLVLGIGGLVWAGLGALGVV